MAKQSKIEKFGCGDIVHKGIKAGKSVRQIAQECSDFAKEGISHTAVAKYIKDQEDKEQLLKKEVIAMHKTRVLKTVNQEIDIIQTNLDVTKRMIERFEMIDDMPKTFKHYMDGMYEVIEKNGADTNFIEFFREWQSNFENELRRKVYEIATLNKEVRENMKFTVQLREKAFQFELVQEYIGLFMEIFQEESKDGAYERAVTRIATNPRMKQLVDQQKLYVESGG
ncbi:hypothetical protein ACX93W_05275 [Paenibacillus sp. CAU 1782]